MFNKLVPESPWCLHSLKWRRLPFPWLTAGILQIFVCFYFHCRGGERARRMTAHSNMAVGFCSDLKRVICQRVTSYLQTVLGVCCGLYRVPDLLRSKSEHQDWCHFSCQSQKNHPQVLFSHEQFNLLSLILQYIKDQQHRCIDVRRFSRCPPPLSEFPSCVKMVGRVSGCEWPSAIPSLPWLSHVRLKHWVAAGFKGGGPSQPAHQTHTVNIRAGQTVRVRRVFVRGDADVASRENGPDATLKTSSWSSSRWDLTRLLSCYEWAIFLVCFEYCPGGKEMQRNQQFLCWSDIFVQIERDPFVTGNEVPQVWPYGRRHFWKFPESYPCLSSILV